MRAKDVMTVGVITVAPETAIEEVASQLLENGISAVPVVDGEDRLLGIVSEGDLMRRAESGTERRPSWWLHLFSSSQEHARDYVKSHGRHAQDVMTRSVVSVGEDAPLDEIAATLEKHRIKRVPVVTDGKVVGIVSRANLLHGLVATKSAPARSADDEAIRGAVLQAVKDAGVRSSFINVIVSGGVAHLWGAVENKAEKDALRVAAENTTGVQDVEDHINVFATIVRATMGAQ